jgi:phosphoglycolate phosphatase-like HAD superfamily hydrolase
VPAPVVLFDLDGTVLTFEGAAPGPGRTALDLAMREVHGVEGASKGLRFAGGTDRALVRAMLRRMNAADETEDIERVLASYLVHLETVLLARRYRPVGDVAGAVDALKARGAVVGVATGNLRAGARLKLASAGLTPMFDLALGGFGCDAEPRAEIVRIAANRCTTACSGVHGARALVVVGDTEHDVRAGRAVGARVIGVAIGEEARAELAAAGAEVVVDACGDDLVRAILD